MLQEAKDLQNAAVTKLVKVLSENKREFTFKAPTGSGKTYMMADFMNRILLQNENIVFIVSSLSKSSLAEQNYRSFVNLSADGTFPKLNPFLINSDSSDEGSLYIPTDCNVYVLPRDLYKKSAKLKKEGTFLNFLKTMTDSLFPGSQGKTLYLIRDECHQETSNLKELQEKNYFSKIINFSATPKLSRKQIPDVEITNTEAEAAKLIKKVDEGKEEESLEDALRKFEEIRGKYVNLLGVNPCMIIQISNKDKAEEELKKTIRPALAKYQDFKWCYITGDAKTCDTNDAIKKLPVAKWKDYMKEKTSSVSVIIFKMVISEGWDIPRACMLYQIRDTESKQLDEQVMGRVRRNPRLLDFETLSPEAQELALTAWVWGIIPKQEGIRQVKLYKDYGIEQSVRVTTTKLQDITETKNPEIDNYIKNLTDTKLGHRSIFEMYQTLTKQENEIQKLCYDHAGSFIKWRLFVENLEDIKKKYHAYICDYDKSMVQDKEVSFPAKSCYNDAEKSTPITLEDWIWSRTDGKSDFSFDSEAERKWAEVLKDIRYSSISKTNNLVLDDKSNKFLWGKNFLLNSDIRFEYYLDGIHKSYPDFVMRDKKGRIHVFEVKSVNKSSNVKIDEEEYRRKVEALKECYKECSKKTGHLFYLPLLVENKWQITKYEGGNESTLTKEMFIMSLPK